MKGIKIIPDSFGGTVPVRITGVSASSLPTGGLTPTLAYGGNALSAKQGASTVIGVYTYTIGIDNEFLKGIDEERTISVNTINIAV